MFIVKKNRIHRVQLINKGAEKTLIKLDKEELFISNNSIYYSYKEANVARAEMKIVKDFKKKNITKQGYGRCAYCNEKLHKEQLSVDHIRCLASYPGKRRGLRDNEDLWSEAWDESNLCLSCNGCNEEKDRLHAKTFINRLDRLDRQSRLLNLKKTKRSGIESYNNRNYRKVGFGVSSSSKYPKGLHNEFSSIYAARADSNQIRLDLVLC